MPFTPHSPPPRAEAPAAAPSPPIPRAAAGNDAAFRSSTMNARSRATPPPTPASGPSLRVMPSSPSSSPTLSCSLPAPSPHVAAGDAGRRRRRCVCCARLRFGTALLIVFAAALACVSVTHYSTITRHEGGATCSSFVLHGARSGRGVPISALPSFGVRYAYALGDATSPPRQPEESAHVADAASASHAARELPLEAHLTDALPTDGTHAGEGSDATRTAEVAGLDPAGHPSAPERRHAPHGPRDVEHRGVGGHHHHPHGDRAGGPPNEYALAARLEGFFRSSLDMPVPPDTEFAARPNPEALRWRMHHEGGLPRRAGEELDGGTYPRAASTEAGGDTKKNGGGGDGVGVRDALDAAQDAGGDVDTVVFDGTEPRMPSPHARRTLKCDADVDGVTEGVVEGDQSAGDDSVDGEDAEDQNEGAEEKAFDAQAPGAASSFFSSSNCAPRQGQWRPTPSASAPPLASAASGAAQRGGHTGEGSTAASGSGGRGDDDGLADAQRSPNPSSKRAGSAATAGPHLGDTGAAVNREVAPHDDVTLDVARNVQNRWREYRGSYPTLRELIRDLVWSYKEQQRVKQACRRVLTAERGKWTSLNDSATWGKDASANAAACATPPSCGSDRSGTPASTSAAADCAGASEPPPPLPTLRTSLDWVRYLPYVPIFPIEEALKHLEHERDDDILLALFYSPDLFNTYNYIQWISLMVHATCSLLRVGAIDPIARVRDDIDHDEASSAAGNSSTLFGSAGAGAAMQSTGGGHDRRSSTSSAASAAASRGAEPRRTYCAGLTLPPLDGLLGDDDVRLMRNNTVRVAIIDGYYPKRHVTRTVWRHLGKDTYHVHERDWDLASRDDEARSRAGQRAAPAEEGGGIKSGAAAAGASSARQGDDAEGAAHARGGPSAESVTPTWHDAARDGPPVSEASEGADDWGPAFLEQRNALLRLLAHEGGLSDDIREALWPLSWQHRSGGGGGSAADGGGEVGDASAAVVGDSSTTTEQQQQQQHQGSQQRAQPARRDEGRGAALEGWREQQQRRQQRRDAQRAGRHHFNFGAGAFVEASVAELEAEAAASARASAITDEATSRFYWRDRIHFIARYIIGHNENLVLDRPSALLDALQASLDQVRQREQRLVEKVFSWGQTMKYRLHVNVSAQRMEEFSSEHLCDSRYRGILPPGPGAASEERDDDDELPVRSSGGATNSAAAQQQQQQQDGMDGRVQGDRSARRFSTDGDSGGDVAARRTVLGSQWGCYQFRPLRGVRGSSPRHGDAAPAAANRSTDGAEGGGSADDAGDEYGEDAFDVGEASIDGMWGPDDATTHELNVQYVDGMDEVGLDEADQVSPRSGVAAADAAGGSAGTEARTPTTTAAAMGGAASTTSSSDSLRLLGAAARRNYLLRQNPPVLLFPRKQGSRPYLFPQTLLRLVHLGFPEARGQLSPAQHANRLRARWGCLSPTRESASSAKAGAGVEGRGGQGGGAGGGRGAAAADATGPTGSGTSPAAPRAPPTPFTYRVVSVLDNPFSRIAVEHLHYDFVIAGPSSAVPIVQILVEEARRVSTPGELEARTHRESLYRLQRREWQEARAKAAAEELLLHPDANATYPSSPSPLECEQGGACDVGASVAGENATAARGPHVRHEEGSGGAGEGDTDAASHADGGSDDRGDQEAYFFEHDVSFRLDPDRFIESAPLTLHFFLRTPAHVVEEEIIEPLRVQVQNLRQQLLDAIVADAYRSGACDMSGSRFMRLLACGSDAVYVNGTRQSSTDANSTTTTSATQGESAGGAETASAAGSLRPYAYTPQGRSVARALRGSAALSVWRFTADIQRRSVAILQARLEGQGGAPPSSSSPSSDGSAMPPAGSRGPALGAVPLPRDLASVVELLHAPYGSGLGLSHCASVTAGNTSTPTATTGAGVGPQDEEGEEVFGLHTPFFLSLLVGEEYGLMGMSASDANAAERHQRFLQHRELHERLSVLQVAVRELVKRSLAGTTDSFFQLISADPAAALLVQPVAESSPASPAAPPACMAHLNTTYVAAMLLFFNSTAEAHFRAHPLNRRRMRLSQRLKEAVRLSRQARLILLTATEEDYRTQYVDMVIQDAARRFFIFRQLHSPPESTRFFSSTANDRDVSAVVAVASPGDDVRHTAASAEPGWDEADEVDDANTTAGARVRAPPIAEAERRGVQGEVAVDVDLDDDDDASSAADLWNVYTTQAHLSPFLFNIIHYDLSAEAGDAGDAGATQFRPVVEHVGVASGAGRQSTVDEDGAARQRQNHVHGDADGDRHRGIGARAGSAPHRDGDGGAASHVDRFDLGGTDFASAATKDAASHEHYGHDDVRLFHTHLADHDVRGLTVRLTEEDDAEEMRRLDAETRNAADAADTDDGADAASTAAAAGAGGAAETVHRLLPPYVGDRDADDEGVMEEEEEAWLGGVQDGDGGDDDDDDDDDVGSACSGSGGSASGGGGHCGGVEDGAPRSLPHASPSPRSTSQWGPRASAAPGFAGDAPGGDGGLHVAADHSEDEDGDAELSRWLPVPHHHTGGEADGGGGVVLDPHDIGHAGTTADDLVGADTELDDDVTAGGHGEYDTVLPFLWRYGGLPAEVRRRRLAEHHRHVRELRRRLIDVRLQWASTLWNRNPQPERAGQEDEVEDKAPPRDGEAA